MAVACLKTDHQWFAVRVRSRAEKTTEASLVSRGFEIFCPTYEERRPYSDRVKKLASPLFPGYLFCKLDWADRLPVLSTPNVDYIVGFGEEPTPVSAQEIASLQSLVEAGVEYQPHPYLKVGQRVRLEAGPLANLEGVLVNTRGVNRLVVSVSLLQRSVATEVDSASVRPL